MIRASGQVFREILADALICCDYYGYYQHPGNEEARALFRYSDEDMAYLVNSRGEAITTRGIMETAATVNEIVGLTLGEKSSVTAYVGTHAPQSQGDGIR